MPGFRKDNLMSMGGDMYSLPQLLPKRYTDDSIIPAIVTNVIPSAKVDAGGLGTVEGGWEGEEEELYGEVEGWGEEEGGGEEWGEGNGKGGVHAQERIYEVFCEGFEGRVYRDGAL